MYRERERGTQEITHYLQLISHGFSIKWISFLQKVNKLILIKTFLVSADIFCCLVI